MKNKDRESLKKCYPGIWESVCGSAYVASMERFVNAGATPMQLTEMKPSMAEQAVGIADDALVEIGEWLENNDG